MSVDLLDIKTYCGTWQMDTFTPIESVGLEPEQLTVIGFTTVFLKSTLPFIYQEGSRYPRRRRSIPSDELDFEGISMDMFFSTRSKPDGGRQKIEICEFFEAD